MNGDGRTADPWAYTIDQVVETLCSPHGLLQINHQDTGLDIPALETNIRRNGIKGQFLLTGLDNDTLRDTFQLDSLGQRLAVLDTIDQLRQASPRFSTWLQSRNASGSAGLLTGPAAFTAAPASSPKPLPFQVPNSTTLHNGSPGISLSSAADPSLPTTKQAPQLPTSDSHGASRSSPQEFPSVSQHSVPRHPSRLGETFVQDATGRKRRKLAIGRLETFTPTTEDGSVSIQSSLKSDAPARTADPKVVFSKTKNAFFLGPRALPVNSVFYGSIKIGHPVEQSTWLKRSEQLSRDFDAGPSRFPVRDGQPRTMFRFSERTSAVSSGRAQYVNGLMKQYLGGLSRPKQGIQKGSRKPLFAITPYHARLTGHGKKDEPASATAFVYGVPYRVKRSWWSAGESNIAKSLATDSHDLRASSSTSPRSIPTSDDMDVDEDPILPLYGDSGSEGGYDTETWDEITHEMDEGQETASRQPLPRQEIESIVDEEISAMRTLWAEASSEVLAQRAWSLWDGARRKHIIQHKIQTCNQRREELRKRMKRFRDDIVSDTWLHAADLRKLCQILEPTVTSTCQNDWEVSVLSSEEPPPKPPGQPRRSVPKKRFEQTDIAEEGIETKSSSDDDWLEDTEAPPLLPPDSADSPVADDSVDNATEARGTIDVLSPLTANGGIQPKAQTPLRKPSIAATSGRHLSPGASSRDDDDHGDDDAIARQLDAGHTTPSRLPTLSVRAKDGASHQSDVSEASQKALILPQWKNVFDIKAFDEAQCLIWCKARDRERLLSWLVSRVSRSARIDARRVLSEQSDASIKSDVFEALETLSSGEKSIRRSQRGSEGVVMMAVWFATWVSCRLPSLEHGASRASISEAQLAREDYRPFLRCLQTLLQLWKPHDESLQRDGAVTQEANPRATSSIDTSHNRPRRNRGRPRLIPLNAEGQSLRENARRRAEERRRQSQALRDYTSTLSNDDTTNTRIAVNPSVSSQDELIFIHEHIARRTKQHQIEGIQFLWTEVIAAGEGCLLAHAMGLGKTMQCIAFLVAIADASRSESEVVRAQLPHDLLEPRILIACPSSLVENWHDELLTWIPPDGSWPYSKIKQVTSRLALQDRLWELDDWSQNGGILLISYAMLVQLCQKSTRVEHAAVATALYKDAEHVRDTILSRSHVVIADEAHYFKNGESELAKVMHGFTTNMRVALTGSPLSNNLEEYFQLVDWIQKNYLGDVAEFRARFVRPIKDGLYQDAEPWEKRRSLKLLSILKSELEPKVQRFDTSVLRDRLPRKVEFVIRVMPTKVQEGCYNAYMASFTTAKGRMTQANLWAMLSVLRLLCSHPLCFFQRIMKDEKEETTSDAPLTASSPDASADDAIELEAQKLLNKSLSRLGLDPRMLEEQKHVLKSLPDLSATNLSNKMLLLTHILRAVRATGEKLLVFSQSLMVLDHIETILHSEGIAYKRMDGSSSTNLRQQLTKDFNTGTCPVLLISTRAGGTGLNLQAANRVVIMDDGFNPMHEEQAIGRAYRLGQTKRVYVYRLVMAGSFEEALQNQALFKTQLASRVVDRKDIERKAKRDLRQYIHKLKAVMPEDVAEYRGQDCDVLDHFLNDDAAGSVIQSIRLAESFKVERPEELTQEEKAEVATMTQAVRNRRNGLTPLSSGLFAGVNFGTENRPVLPIPTAPALSTLNGILASQKPAQQTSREGTIEEIPRLRLDSITANRYLWLLSSTPDTLISKAAAPTGMPSQRAYFSPSESHPQTWPLQSSGHHSTSFRPSLLQHPSTLHDQLQLNGMQTQAQHRSDREEIQPAADTISADQSHDAAELPEPKPGPEVSRKEDETASDANTRHAPSLPQTNKDVINISSDEEDDAERPALAQADSRQPSAPPARSVNNALTPAPIDMGVTVPPDRVMNSGDGAYSPPPVSETHAEVSHRVSSLGEEDRLRAAAEGSQGRSAAGTARSRSSSSDGSDIDPSPRRRRPSASKAHSRQLANGLADSEPSVRKKVTKQTPINEVSMPMAPPGRRGLQGLGESSKTSPNAAAGPAVRRAPRIGVGLRNIFPRRPSWSSAPASTSSDSSGDSSGEADGRTAKESAGRHQIDGTGDDREDSADGVEASSDQAEASTDVADAEADQTEKPPSKNPCTQQ